MSTANTSQCSWNVRNTKVPNALTVLTFGDVHLGQATTGTDWIIQSLYAITSDPTVAVTVDIIMIEGDLFDHLLYLNYTHLDLIQIWGLHLLKYCAKNNIALRVLEGTPGHDMRQSNFFNYLNTGYDVKCDLLYVTDLHYEVHPKLGVSILYLPDEHRSDCVESYELAKRLLAEHGVSKADFILMHGAFDYQLPAIVKNTHSSNAWQELVEYYIFVGHVHQYSQYGKILAAGSLERLCHGDEGDKGHLRVTIKPTGQHDIRFVKNTRAKVYLTIDCKGLTAASAIELIKNKLRSIPKQSYVRILALRTDNIAVALDVIKVEFPDYYWKLERATVESDTPSDVEINLLETYTPIDLTKNNIPTLIKERLINNNVSANKIARAMELLERAL